MLRSARSAQGRGLQYPSRAPLERRSSSSTRVLVLLRPPRVWLLLRPPSAREGRRRLQVMALVVAQRGSFGEPFSQARLGLPGVAKQPRARGDYSGRQHHKGVFLQKPELAVGSLVRGVELILNLA